MKHIPDLLMIGGAGGISYGVWLMHQPAGYMVIGCFALLAGVMMAKVAAK